MKDRLTQPLNRQVSSLSLEIKPKTSANRMFSFLFDGLINRKWTLYEIIRLGVIISLAVSLFGVEVFTQRGAGTIVGKRLGNLGAMLHFFNLFFWMPLTFLFGIMQFRRGLLRLGLILRANIWSLAFLAFLFYSAQFSEAPDIGEFRFNQFLKYVLPVIASGIVLSDPRSVIYLRDGFLVFAALKMLAFLLAPAGFVAIIQGQNFGLAASDIGARLVLEGDTMPTGYQMGFFCLTAWIVFRQSLIVHRLEQYTFMFLIGILFFVQVLSGWRGSIATLVVSLISFMLIQKGNVSIKKIMAFILIFSVATFMAATLLGDLLPSGYDRYRMSLTPEISQNLRFAYTLEALSAPLTLGGRGVGSFGAYYATEFDPVYTHNVFTEMYYEGGIIGLILFLLASGTAFLSMWRDVKNNGDPVSIYCLIGFIFFFMFLQFSSYVLGEAGFWLFLTMGSTCIGLSRRDRVLAQVNHSFHRVV